jgi:predicted NBD/HSP70 family sugar kinase
MRARLECGAQCRLRRLYRTTQFDAVPENRVAVTGDQRLLKTINKVALVRLVREQADISRADLAKRTGLTKSTVSLLVHELIREGWLREQQIAVTERVGRRPTPLCLDDRRLVLLGAELGVDFLVVMACDLTGKVLTVLRETYEHKNPQTSAERLVALTKRVLTKIERSGRVALGLGVGVPGVVDATGSILKSAPNLHWHDVQMGDLVRAALSQQGVASLSVYLHNDANAAALSQFIFGGDSVAGPLVYLSLGIGLGAGIVLKDQLYLGHSGMAGEVGHTIIDPAGPMCSCGRRGCAEAFVSQRSISAEIVGTSGKVLAVEEIADQLSRGNAKAVAAVQHAGERLGHLLFNLCNTLDPAIIVLGGPLSLLGEDFSASAIQSLRRLWGADSPLSIDVRLCQFGANACAMGAAGFVLHRALYPLLHHGTTVTSVGD